MYENSLGVVQDYLTAALWYQLASAQGHSDAQNNLGNLYYEGQGVPQDDEEALKWIELAAEQGNSLAQANLEKMQVR